MEGNKIKLLVFDFDGTVLGGHTPYDQFPKPFVRFLDSLPSRGISWASNTVWETNKQFTLIKRSGVKNMPALLVGQTGRLIATVKNNHLIHDVEHERKVLARDKRFKKKNWPLVKGVFLKLVKADLVDRIAFNFYTHNTVVFSCKKKDCKTVWQILDPLLASGEFYAWDPFNKGESGTLLPYFFNKAEGMKIIQKRLHLGPENIIVAGDETNDLHMFNPKCAGWIVCPSNANPQVRKVVKEQGGVVATRKFSWGVIEGVCKILEKSY